MVNLDNSAREFHILHKHLICRGDSLLVSIDEGNILRSTRVEQGYVPARKWTAKAERRFLDVRKYAAALLCDMESNILSAETRVRAALQERDEAIRRGDEANNKFLETRQQMLAVYRLLAEKEVVIVGLRECLPSIEIVDVKGDSEETVSTYHCSCESCIAKREATSLPDNRAHRGECSVHAGGPADDSVADSGVGMPKQAMDEDRMKTVHDEEAQLV
ncbi:hypothetical protein CBR_g12092 [Chara braunii]|uniref:Uncharacterized protein n=1 Tax=Chara braunii TaxID=69332 RepID=A0A388KR23_CHABU|nr:hypothetical protein CBR_g12092 [Chara braunii]|eukprot:GBG72521.1 hypothetical protein CBR_g12092 [Chara braunii]